MSGVEFYAGMTKQSLTSIVNGKDSEKARAAKAVQVNFQLIDIDRNGRISKDEFVRVSTLDSRPENISKEEAYSANVADDIHKDPNKKLVFILSVDQNIQETRDYLIQTEAKNINAKATIVNQAASARLKQASKGVKSLKDNVVAPLGSNLISRLQNLERMYKK